MKDSRERSRGCRRGQGRGCFSLFRSLGWGRGRGRGGAMRECVTPPLELWELGHLLRVLLPRVMGALGHQQVPGP